MRSCPYLYFDYHSDQFRGFNHDSIDEFYVLNEEEIYYHPQALSPGVVGIAVRDFRSII